MIQYNYFHPQKHLILFYFLKNYLKIEKILFIFYLNKNSNTKKQHHKNYYLLLNHFFIKGFPRFSLILKDNSHLFKITLKDPQIKQ